MNHSTPSATDTYVPVRRCERCFPLASRPGDDALPQNICPARRCPQPPRSPRGCPCHGFTGRAANSNRPVQNVRGQVSPAPRAAGARGAAAVKEGLRSLIFSFSNHILLEQRDPAELGRPQPVACAGQGGESGSRLPGCETPTRGLRRARSHQNPPPKALSVHDPAARASRGPTRPSAVVDSQEAAASKCFVACLRWVDRPAPTPGHSRRGAPLRGAPAAWHKMPESLAAPRARGFHAWLAAR